jgi:hypothetical protein
MELGLLALAENIVFNVLSSLPKGHKGFALVSVSGPTASIAKPRIGGCKNISVVICLWP